MDWSRHVPAVSPPFPFIHEVTGDSDDTCDRIVTIASGSGTAYPCINVATAVDIDGDGDDDGRDDDDACSCSHELWYIMGDAKIRHGKKKDDDDDDDDDGTEYDCRGYGCRDYQFTHREKGIPDMILDSTPIDQEAMESSYEVVKGAVDMRRMEDKVFWETCLAVGYP